MSSYTHLLYHIVFSTKEREPLVTSEVQDELYRYIGGVIRNQRGICIEVGGMPDHVHILARFRASISVSDMVQAIKGNSSKWAGEKLRTPKSLYWQEGYGAFSVSRSADDQVAAYIRNQEQHHRKHDFKTELVTLLDRHDIEYDPQYLWD